MGFCFPLLNIRTHLNHLNCRKNELQWNHWLIANTTRHPCISQVNWVTPTVRGQRNHHIAKHWNQSPSPCEFNGYKGSVNESSSQRNVQIYTNTVRVSMTEYHAFMTWSMPFVILNHTWHQWKSMKGSILCVCACVKESTINKRDTWLDSVHLKHEQFEEIMYLFKLIEMICAKTSSEKKQHLQRQTGGE